MAGGFREIIKGWFGRKELGRQNSRTRERGNVFFTLFGAVAVVGVLGAGIMSTMRGPLTTMVEVNRIEETKAEMAVGLRLLLLNATNQDDDVLTEPNQPASCSGMPTGAGCVPTGGPAKQKDAWGSYYAYCAWNNGSDNDAIGSLIHKGGASTNNIAVALISAGPDRKFDTSCADAGTFLTPSDGGGDDIVRKYNYNDAVAGSDGLWALQGGSSGDEARVEEEISVGGGASATSTFEGGAAFGNSIRTEGEIQTDVVSPHPSNSLDYIEFTGSVLLPEVTGLSCGGNEGAIAFDASEDIVAFCDGSSWQPLGKKFWIADANGIRNNDTLAPHVGIGTGSSSAYSFYVNGGSATDTLKATGIVDFDSTLNVDGAATLKDSLEVTSDTKLNAKLDVVGATELDATLGVDGESEFRADVTVISDVYVNKTATGGGNITAEDAITATEGDITATAGNVVATAGNVEATAGDVTAGQDVIAERHVKATTGDVEAVAGDVVATAGNVEAVEGNIVALGTSGKIVGKSFHRGSDGALDFSDIEPCDPETEKTVWSTISGWGCEPDNGTGTGTGGESTLEDVLGRGNDAGGQNAEDFGKIGADEYCDAGLSTCVSSADLISGSSIWIRNTGDTSKIYYNGGYVGIGTNDPQTPLDIYSSATGYSLSLSVADESTSPSIVFYSKRGDPLETLGSNNPSGGNKGWRVGPIGNTSPSTELQNDFYIASWDGAAWASRITFEMGGNVGIGVGSATAAATKLDINGTLKIGDGTELCNAVEHEGAIKYDADDDEFYVCRLAATGWEPIGSGSGSAGGGGGSAPSFMLLTVPGGHTYVNDGVVPFTNVKAQGGSNISQSGGEVTLKGGHTYRLMADLRMTGTNTGLGFRFVEKITDAQLGVPGADYTGTAHASWSEGMGVAYVSPNVDKTYLVKSGSITGSPQTHPGSGFFLIEELGGGSGAGGGAIVAFDAAITTAGVVSLPSASAADIGSWTQRREEGGDNFNASTGKFTAPSNGFYHFSGQLSIENPEAHARMALQTETPGKKICYIGDRSQTGDLTDGHVGCSGTIYLTTGEVVEMEGWQGSASTQNVTSAYFSGFKIGSGGSGGAGSGGQDVSFSVHRNSVNQTVTSNTSTLMDWTTVRFDTNHNFDLATDRFTPTVAGKYIVRASAYCIGNTGYCTVRILKNGVSVSESSIQSTGAIVNTVTVIDMNGTTDYLESWALNGGGTVIHGHIANTHFSGALIGGGGGSDTLAGLSCSTGQVAAWDGDSWECSSSAGGGSGIIWVNFNGTNGNIIEGSGVSSVTKVSTGQYTVTLSQALPNANYAVIGGHKTNTSASDGAVLSVKAKTATTIQIALEDVDAGYEDYPEVYIAVLSSGIGGSGSDTLAGLSCTSGQVAAWDGSAWACADQTGGSGGGGGSGNGEAVGMVGAFSMASCPAGWLKADGTAVSRTTYADLFAAIGTTYGVGDGSTTFNLPELRGEFLRGLDDGRGIDAGRTLGTFQEGTGILANSNSSQGFVGTISNHDGLYTGTSVNGKQWNASDNSSTSVRRVRPRNMAVMYCINATGIGADTLAGLSCTSGQVAAWNGTAWACANGGSGGGSMGAWQNMTASRAVTTTYTNNTGSPLAVSIILDAIGLTQQRSSLVVDGLTIATVTPSDYYSSTAATAHYSTLSGMVPAGATYQLVAASGTPTIIGWYEAMFGGGGSDTLAGLSCSTGQVAAWDGDSWECSDIGSGFGSGDTVIEDFPDAIACYNGTNRYVVVIAIQTATSVEYQRVDDPSHSSGNMLKFTSSGAYSMHGNLSGYDCINKSVSELYTEGKAFNFVGGGSGSDTLAGLSCTDGQVAVWDDDTDEWICADQTGGSGSGAIIAFSAKGGSRNITSSVIENFATELENIGSAFDTATGIFTAPSDGIYFFSANARINANDTNVNIYKNGALVNSSHQDTGLDGQIVTSLISLASGDEVTMVMNSAPFGGTSTNFQGFKLGGGSAGSGSDIWSDSGDGYIEYSVADSGVKLANITGMAQPALGLASGMTWDAGTNTLSITGNVTYTGTITDTSDRRLKTGIENLIQYGSMLDKINAIDTYSFRMKDAPEAGKEFGVMAQELEGIFPELVHTANDEMGTKSVNYVGLIAPMIEATKELSRKNAALEEQVALLNKIVAARDTQKASATGLWLLLAFFGGLGGTLIVMALPLKIKRRWERN